MRLIPITQKKALQENGVWHSVSTLRQWHHFGKYPDVIVKAAGRLFIDIDKWREVLN